MSAAQHTPGPWPAYRDMTAEQMLEWGTDESAARQADLAGVASAEALKAAQERAEQRRKAIGASRSAASAMVIDANRAARIAKATGSASFLIDGQRVALGDLLAANADDAELCEWARHAQPGERFPALVGCECVATGDDHA